jgi:flavin reductase (DIM6/NTAB) family NADH-FMN oxidoreductase RutF
MIVGFKQVDVKDIKNNPFTLISEGLLITAGDENKYNMMTASWGGVGVFWGKNAATVYIRPQRYTREFVDQKDTFTLSFFNPDYKKALGICGSVSGRDVDKTEQTGLTPVFSDGTTYFEQADIVMVCKKLYHSDIIPENFDETQYDEKMYPSKDYHRIYIAEILKVLVKA